MMNDDNQFDAILRDAAQDYNKPPSEIPRDAMWTGIEAAQLERARRPLHIVPPSPRRSLTRYTWFGAAAAAVLLVATGVGIGRWSNARGAAPQFAGNPRAVASSSGKSVVPPPANIPDERATASGEPSTDNGQRIPDGGQRVAGQRTADSGERRTEGGGRRAESEGRSTVNAQPSTVNAPPSMLNGSSGVPYQVATIRHLANAEALLTAFRTDSRDAKMDAQLSKWARDLLSNTRLLLDSPAGDDPQRAKLLGDLELVLAQIVQLSPGAAAQDRELIEGSIRNGQMMTRLRYAIPAGPTRGL